MCQTSKMIVLFFILFKIQSNSAYRKESFVFVKPSNKGLNSHSGKADIYNRNKRHKLEQIRARHENKLTFSTGKYDLGAELSKILLDNKDAEIFHNKNTNIKRSVKCKSKVKKNAYNRLGYDYLNEEEDSKKENEEGVPKRRRENKHPFEKLILNKIKAHKDPLSKRKDYYKHGFRDNKELRLQAGDTNNLIQNGEFIPPEADVSTSFPIISNDDYIEEESTETKEEQSSQILSVTTTERVTEIMGTNSTENITNSTTNRNKPAVTVNVTNLYKINTTEFTKTPIKINTEVNVVPSKRTSSTSNSSKVNSVTSSKTNSTFEPDKNISPIGFSKNGTTATVDDARKNNSTLAPTTKNDSATICFDINEIQHTTCEVCFTLFPRFGTQDDENNDNMSVSISNSTSSSVNKTTNVSGLLSNTTTVSLSSVIETTTTSSNKSSETTTENSNQNGKSPRLTKRNPSVFEYNLFDRVDSDITSGYNLMQDTTSTISLQPEDLLRLGITGSIQLEATTARDLQSEIKTERNLQPEITAERNFWSIVVTKQNLQSKGTKDTNLQPGITKERNFLAKDVTKCNLQLEGATEKNLQSGITKEKSLWLEITTKENLHSQVVTECNTVLTVIDTATSYITERAVANKTESTVNTTNGDCMTLFVYTIQYSESPQTNVSVPVTLPQTETMSMTPPGFVTNLIATAAPVHTVPSLQKSINNILNTKKEEFKFSTSRTSNLFKNNLVVKPDIPIINPMNISNLSVNVSLQLAQPVSQSELPNTRPTVTTIINYTHSSTEIIKDYNKLPIYTLHNSKTEYVTSGTALPVTVALQQFHFTNMTTAAVSSLSNITHNETMVTKLGYSVKLPQINLPFFNKRQTELPICTNATEKFTLFPQKINTTISKLAVYTFHKSMHSVTPCVYASEVTKKSQKEKFTLSSIGQTLPKTTHISELSKHSVEVTSPVLQGATNATQASTTSYIHTVPSAGFVYTIKPSVSVFQQPIFQSACCDGVVTAGPSIITPSVTVQQSMVGTTSQTTSSRLTVFRNIVQSPEIDLTPLQTAQLMSQTTPPNNLNHSFPFSELTSRKLKSETTPSTKAKPSLLAALSSAGQLLPQTATDGMQSTTVSCVTLFPYTIPSSESIHTVKVPVPVDQQHTFPPQSQGPSSQDVVPQTIPSVQDKPRPLPEQTTVNVIIPAIPGTKCIPVPVIAGHAKGGKVYPIRHKGGDPGNNYYKRPAVTKRFSKRPLLCTTIKFVECTTQYQPILQTVLQCTEKVFIPKAIATKAATQTCKPDSSDCSSCDFGNALPEMLPNKVELPPNPMPPVNLDFPKGKDDTSCMDINQILNFTSTP